MLELEELPEPTPAPGEVLVRLRATSVNHRDVWMRKGHPSPAYQVTLPAILGIDVCGEVVEVGANVEGLRAGDRVTANPYRHCGSCRYCQQGRFQDCPRFAVFRGTYAEMFTVPASTVVPVVDCVPDAHVACFPNTYITAWQMLVGKAQVSPADTVFVWAGTSGLGSAAIEIAALAGATVIASAGSDRKLEILRGRCPGLVLDHRDPRLVDEVRYATAGEGATIVFEHVGAATWSRSLQLCAPGGTIVSAGATSGDDARMDVTFMFANQLRILGSRLGTMSDTFAAVAQLNAGRFSPLIDQIYPLAEVGEAHRRMDAGEAVGKLVIAADL